MVTAYCQPFLLFLHLVTFGVMRKYVVLVYLSVLVAAIDSYVNIYISKNYLNEN